MEDLSHQEVKNIILKNRLEIFTGCPEKIEQEMMSLFDQYQIDGLTLTLIERDPFEFFKKAFLVILYKRIVSVIANKQNQSILEMSNDLYNPLTTINNFEAIEINSSAQFITAEFPNNNLETIQINNTAQIITSELPNNNIDKSLDATTEPDKDDNWHVNFVFPRESMSKRLEKRLKEFEKEKSADPKASLEHVNNIELVKIVADAMVLHVM